VDCSDDWALSTLAQALGFSADYALFNQRAFFNYKLSWNSE
jgi:hypothetical protein